MRRRCSVRFRIGCLPVVDGSGRLVGIFSETDALRALISGKGRAERSPGRARPRPRAPGGGAARRARPHRRPARTRADRRARAVGHGAAARRSINAERALHLRELSVEEPLAALAAHRLDAIDHALARVAHGQLGRCEKCGHEIPIARLRALPGAVLCVRCASVQSEDGAMKSKQPKKDKAGHPRRPTAADPERGPGRHLPEQARRRRDQARRGDGLLGVRRGLRRRPLALGRRSRNPTGEHRALCPACQRIRDRYPAGEVRISGEFARAHRDEILARSPPRRGAREGGASAAAPDGRARGRRALCWSPPPTSTWRTRSGARCTDAFKGELHAPWQEKGDLLRVSWTR